MKGRCYFTLLAQLRTGAEFCSKLLGSHSKGKRAAGNHFVTTLLANDFGNGMKPPCLV